MATAVEPPVAPLDLRDTPETVQAEERPAEASTERATQPAQEPEETAEEKALKKVVATLDQQAAAFECNVCLELASEPVVTLCGHLYCWPCLYRWMQVQSYCRQCPVCKAGVDIDKVVPIYGRGSENPEPREDVTKLAPLPPRPVGQRLPVVHHGLPPGAQNAPAAGQQQQQQGILPALFGFQLGPGQGYVEALTPEQQHQAFLSRLLLMLGSFVIMCLLLF